MRKIIKARELSFSYDNELILENITFEQDFGESIAFIGLSGGGKSTLLKVLAGILKPKDGLLDVATKEVAYVSQGDGLLPWLTVLENVILRERLNGKVAPIEQAKYWLDVVGLSGYASFYPYQLSGGMKKRVELARAFLQQPELLLLDEPFSALDLFHREKLNKLMKDLSSEHGIALVLVTHSLDEACFLADRIYGITGHPAYLGIITEMSRFQEERKEELPRLPEGKEQLRNFFYESIDREITQSRPMLSSYPIHTKSHNRQMLQALLITAGSLMLLLSLGKYFFAWPDYLMPYPQKTIVIWWQTLRSGMIIPHVIATMSVAWMGFGVALMVAIPLGYLFNKSRIFRQYGMPIVLMANTIPTVAIAPFIVMWFGFGILAKVITVFLIVWLPLLIGSYQAFRFSWGAMQEHIHFFQPTWWRRIFFLELPASIAQIFASIKVSVTLSVVGAVLGEFIAGSKGLGALLNIAKANYNTPLMFSALIWLMLLGLFSYGLMHIAEHWVLRHHWGYLNILEK